MQWAPSHLTNLYGRSHLLFARAHTTSQFMTYFAEVKAMGTLTGSDLGCQGLAWVPIFSVCGFVGLAGLLRESFRGRGLGRAACSRCLYHLQSPTVHSSCSTSTVVLLRFPADRLGHHGPKHLSLT